MANEKSLDNIIDSKSKIAVIRLFISKAGNFKATGREIAKLIHFSPPATHAVLKDLFNHKILKLDIIGRQHIYSLDSNNRVVRQILRPIFKREVSLKDEIKDYLLKQVRHYGLKAKLISLILYGSIQKGNADTKSDADIAMVVKNKNDKSVIEEIFSENISVKFYEYFKVHLDVYVKSKEEFRLRLKKNLPPVSTLIKAYTVILGRDPLDI